MADACRTIAFTEHHDMAPFDVYSPEFFADPYAAYAQMRRDAPVFYDPDHDLTFFARYADVAALLRHRSLGRAARETSARPDTVRPEAPAEWPTWTRLVRGSFIDLEPPRHTLLRKLVAPAFTRSLAATHRKRLERYAEVALDRAVASGTVEAIGDYATPIALSMIGDLMGIPAADRDQLVTWSHAIVRPFDYNVTVAEGETAERATIEFAAYLRRELARRRSHRTSGDLLGTLAANSDPDVSDEDRIATAILVLNAGHEATVHAVGNGLLALATHGEEYQRVRSRPELIDSAVEEVLRWDTPLQMFERWAYEDVRFAGHTISAGDKVGLLLGSANRDGDRFTEPDRLDVARTPNPHLSFGAGVHHCVGAPLAREELRAALGVFARRVAEFEIAQPAEPIDSFVFRGVKALHLRLSGLRT